MMAETGTMASERAYAVGKDIYFEGASRPETIIERYVGGVITALEEACGDIVVNHCFEEFGGFKKKAMGVTFPHGTPVHRSLKRALQEAREAGL